MSALNDSVFATQKKANNISWWLYTTALILTGIALALVTARYVNHREALAEAKVEETRPSELSARMISFDVQDRPSDTGLSPLIEPPASDVRRCR